MALIFAPEKAQEGITKKELGFTFQESLYTPIVFITCITWTQNMPRHDKVKINRQMGRLEEKIAGVLLY